MTTSKSCGPLFLGKGKWYRFSVSCEWRRLRAWLGERRRARLGFVTHCSWNSMLESIAHGVLVVTWPHFSDQFLNERFAVDVLGVGVMTPVLLFGDEAMAVTRGDVAWVVIQLMDGGERRRKAKEYGEKACRAMEKGGSSYESLTQLIHSFTLQGAKNAVEQ
uniref:Flavonoid glucosyl-transferase-like n=1 Tax=Oryza sativa subsp. japonica TaxID=39947 RepID=Q6Z7I0_ORYSJ|nr:flavonoid glucosyl-transferase-like [Oryza sativa Japonica Group]